MDYVLIYFLLVFSPLILIFFTLFSVLHYKTAVP